VQVLADATGLADNREYLLAAPEAVTGKTALIKDFLTRYRATTDWGIANPAERAKILSPELKIDEPTTTRALARSAKPLAPITPEIGAELQTMALGSFFPLYFNTYAGIRDIDQRLVEAARTCGLGQWQRLRHVVLPGALPSLFLGLRLAIGAAWLSLVVGEQVNAQTGIGFLMMEAREFAQTDIVVFGLLVYAGLGLLSDTLIRIAERRTLAWRRGLQAT
jgi:hypothetical protein